MRTYNKGAIPDVLNAAELERYSGKTAPESRENCYRYVDLSFASVGQPVMYATAEGGRKSPCDGLNAAELDRYLRAGG